MSSSSLPWLRIPIVKDGVEGNASHRSLSEKKKKGEDSFRYCIGRTLPFERSWIDRPEYIEGQLSPSWVKMLALALLHETLVELLLVTRSEERRTHQVGGEFPGSWVFGTDDPDT